MTSHIPVPVFGPQHPESSLAQARALITLHRHNKWASFNATAEEDAQRSEETRMRRNDFHMGANADVWPRLSQGLSAAVRELNSQIPDPNQHFKYTSHATLAQPGKPQIITIGIKGPASTKTTPYTQNAFVIKATSIFRATDEYNGTTKIEAKAQHLAWTGAHREFHDIEGTEAVLRSGGRKDGARVDRENTVTPTRGETPNEIVAKAFDMAGIWLGFQTHVLAPTDAAPKTPKTVRQPAQTPVTQLNAAD